MFKLFRLKWKREFEEQASLHRIAMAEKDAAIDRLKKDLMQKHDLDLQKAMALSGLDYQQKSKQQELDLQRKLNEVEKDKSEELRLFKEELSKNYYDKLSVAMAKLHEEGNLTTKFTQELALKMFEKAPETKIRLTSGKSDDK